MTTAAGRSVGRPATSRDSASIPPAEEPMTMSWDPFSSRPPRVPRARDSRSIRAPSLLYLARREARHEIGVGGHAPLVADRPEPGTGQAAVVGEGQLRLEGPRRIDVDRLPPGGRPRVAGYRADGRGDGVELDDLDRIELGRGRWIGEEARIVGRDPDRPVAEARRAESPGRPRASASRTAGSPRIVLSTGTPTASYRSSDQTRSFSAPSRRSIGADAPTSEPA